MLHLTGSSVSDQAKHEERAAVWARERSLKELLRVNVQVKRLSHCYGSDARLALMVAACECSSPC